MLEHTAWPIGAQVKLGAEWVKLIIQTATWAHDETLGGVFGLEPGEGVGGRALAGMPRAAFVLLVVMRMCNHKQQQQQGALSLPLMVYAKASVKGWAWG